MMDLRNINPNFYTEVKEEISYTELLPASKRMKVLNGPMPSHVKPEYNHVNQHFVNGSPIFPAIKQEFSSPQFYSSPFAGSTFFHSNPSPACTFAPNPSALSPLSPNSVTSSCAFTHSAAPVTSAVFVPAAVCAVSTSYAPNSTPMAVSRNFMPSSASAIAGSCAPSSAPVVVSRNFMQNSPSSAASCTPTLATRNVSPIATPAASFCPNSASGLSSSPLSISPSQSAPLFSPQFYPQCFLTDVSRSLDKFHAWVQVSSCSKSDSSVTSVSRMVRNILEKLNPINEDCLTNEEKLYGILQDKVASNTWKASSLSFAVHCLSKYIDFILEQNVLSFKSETRTKLVSLRHQLPKWRKKLHDLAQTWHETVEHKTLHNDNLKMFFQSSFYQETHQILQTASEKQDTTHLNAHVYASVVRFLITSFHLRVPDKTFFLPRMTVKDYEDGAPQDDQFMVYIQKPDSKYPDISLPFPPEIKQLFDTYLIKIRPTVDQVCYGPFFLKYKGNGVTTKDISCELHKVWKTCGVSVYRKRATKRYGAAEETAKWGNLFSGCGLLDDSHKAPQRDNSGKFEAQKSTSQPDNGFHFGCLKTPPTPTNQTEKSCLEMLPQGAPVEERASVSSGEEPSFPNSFNPQTPVVTPMSLRQMRQKSNGKQNFFDAEIAVMRSAFKGMIEGDMSITVSMVDLCMTERLSAVLEKYGYSKVLNRIRYERLSYRRSRKCSYEEHSMAQAMD